VWTRTTLTPTQAVTKVILVDDRRAHLEQMAAGVNVAQADGTQRKFVGYHFADRSAEHLETGLDETSKMFAKLLAHPESRRDLGVAMRLAQGSASIG
jgi:hypothetical protein